VDSGDQVERDRDDAGDHVDEVDPVDQLGHDLAAITRTVPYLTAAIDPPTTAAGSTGLAEAWIGCRRLIDEPAILGALFGTDPIEASLFTQAYAFCVASVPLAGWVLHRRAVDPRPAHLAIRFTAARPWRPARLGLVDPWLTPATVDGLVEHLVDGHLRPFVDAVRATTPVGERLLWGNAVTSMVVVLRALESGVDPARRLEVRADAEAVLAALPVDLDGLGSFVRRSSRPGDDWFWQRTTCCHWFTTPGGGYCDDCSMTPSGA